MSPVLAGRCGKVRYGRKREALEALNRRRRSRYRHKKPDHLRPYFCWSCWAWHLTHERQRTEVGG
jgi:hypothetical protein